MRPQVAAPPLTTEPPEPGYNPLDRVSVVIPTLNEEENLPHVFARLPEGLHQLVIVDGRSTDRTLEVVGRLRPDAEIVLQDGKGKGNALACGFARCTGEIIVMLDADGSTDPAEIPVFVSLLEEGADFAKGSRFLRGGGSSDITPGRRLGNLMLNRAVNFLYRTSYTDLCYGFNAFHRRCLERLVVDCSGFEVETLINIRVAKLGYTVAEVPSFEADRLFGDSHLNTMRDGWRVLRTIAGEWHKRMPARPMHHQLVGVDGTPIIKEVAA
jgi:glycosyltransferase involved in cell wall biosynthesis